MGVCCRIQLCCPPAMAAAELADYMAGGEDRSAPDAGSYLDVARRILRDFQLVPRNIEPVTPQGDPAPVHPANQRLNELHAYIKPELRAILLEAGHPAGEEA